MVSAAGTAGGSHGAASTPAAAGSATTAGVGSAASPIVASSASALFSLVGGSAATATAASGAGKTVVAKLTEITAVSSDAFAVVVTVASPDGNTSGTGVANGPGTGAAELTAGAAGAALLLDAAGAAELAAGVASSGGAATAGDT